MTHQPIEEIKMTQEITTECFEQKQEMVVEWMEEEMTMRSTFQMVIQNILHESIANFLLTAAATRPVLFFEAGENQRHCSAHLERGCGKNVSRDEGHQNSACEQVVTTNRIFAMASAEMYSFIGAQKTIRATNNFSYFFLHPVDQKYRQLNYMFEYMGWSESELGLHCRALGLEQKRL